MNFQQFKNEHKHARAQMDALERGCEREWITPDGRLMIHVRVIPADDHKPDILVNAHPWHDHPGATTTIRGGRELKDGYFDFAGNPLTVLPAKQIEYVAFAKYQVERWVEGFRDDLPETLWERDAHERAVLPVRLSP